VAEEYNITSAGYSNARLPRLRRMKARPGAHAIKACALLVPRVVAPAASGVVRTTGVFGNATPGTFPRYCIRVEQGKDFRSIRSVQARRKRIFCPAFGTEREARQPGFLPAEQTNVAAVVRAAANGQPPQYGSRGNAAGTCAHRRGVSASPRRPASSAN